MKSIIYFILGLTLCLLALSCSTRASNFNKTSQYSILNDDSFLQEFANDLTDNYSLEEAIRKGSELLNHPNSNYHIFGDAVLSKSAILLEEGIRNGNFNPKKDNVKSLIKLLESNKYYIRIDMTDFEKGIMHLKKGNFNYLFDRLNNRLNPHWNKITTCTAILLILVVSLILFSKKLHFRTLSSLVKNSISVILLIVAFTLKSNAQSISESSYKTIWSGEVQINILKSNGSKIGQSVYLSRSSKSIKAMYFAASKGSNSVYERYLNWKPGKQIIACCAGAYLSGNYSTPLGLTIDGGQLVNRNVDSNMDGLVIVEKVGGVRISDLDQPNSIYLLSCNQYVNPRNSSQKQQFIDWAYKEDATVFQTNLMYYKNTPKIGYVSATAERRILALVENSGIVYHVIFNIEESVSLTDIAYELFDLLRNKGLNVIAMINLDTGMCNAFELYNSDGQQLPFKGSSDMSSLSNMIVYYYDQQ